MTGTPELRLEDTPDRSEEARDEETADETALPERAEERADAEEADRPELTDDAEREEGREEALPVPQH